MAKKSFKENPALTFISVGQPEFETKSEHTDTDVYTDNNTQTQRHTDTSNDAHTQLHTDTENTSEQKGSVLFSGKKENKSRRLQLLLRPSTHARLQKIAKTYQTSTNEVINEILEDYLSKNPYQ